MAEQNTWVILLRGINVGGVKVPMADLKKMLEGLGMTEVKTLLASGNVVLESSIGDDAEVKRVVEAALAETFGRKLSVLIRPISAIHALLDADPFAGVTVTKETRLYVTFLGSEAKQGLDLPWRSEDGSVNILGGDSGAVYSVLDLSKTGTVDAMGIIEKAWGKDVTTRNWNTVEKIGALRAR